MLAHAYAYRWMMGSLLVALAGCGPKLGGQNGDDGSGTQTGAATDGASGAGSMAGLTDPASGESTPTGTDPQTSDGAPDGACSGALVLAATQLAYTEDDVPAGQDPTVGLDGLTTGPSELEPGTLILMLSNQALGCADPQATLACPNLSVSLLLSPEMQAPGTYVLQDDENRWGFSLDSYMADSTGGPECEHSASTLAGELEITAIDATSVTGRVCMRTTGGGPLMGGEFVASRCS